LVHGTVSEEPFIIHQHSSEFLTPGPFGSERNHCERRGNRHGAACAFAVLIAFSGDLLSSGEKQDISGAGIAG
jgi:hypothetical protein